jgi:hypothetical protein
MADVRSRIIIDASSRDAVRELDAADRAAADLDRTLDDLDSKRVDIDADTGKVDSANAEVRALRNLADDPVRIDIDVDRERVRRIGEAADETERVGRSAETVQRGIGPLRGFTDELGDGAGQAGIYANAIVDAGETVQVFGEQLGFSQQSLNRIASALGFAGLAVGAASALWSAYTTRQREAREAAEATAEAAREAADAIIAGEVADAAAKIAEEWGTLPVILDRVGISMSDVAGAIGEADMGAGDVAIKLRELGFDEQFIGDAEAFVTALQLAINDAQNVDAIVGEITGSFGEVTAAAGESRDTIREVVDEFDRLVGRLDLDAQTDSIERGFDQVRDAGARAWKAAVDGTEEADEALATYDRQLADLRREVALYAADIDNLPSDRQTEIAAVIESGSVDEVERVMRYLTRLRAAEIAVSVRGFDPRVSGPGGTSLAAPTQSNLTVNVNATPTMRSVDDAVTRWSRLNGYE